MQTIKKILKKTIPQKILNKLVSNYLKIQKQLIPYIWGLIPIKRTAKKFLIFGQGRTGSTLLVNILNSHPEIHCEGEIFNNNQNLGKGNILFPGLLLTGKTKMYRNSAYGFKVKIYQLNNQKNIKSSKSFLKKLAIQNWKIIYLKRENIFEHAMSSVRAGITGVYHQFNDQSKANKFIVDLNTLERLMHNRKTFIEQENIVLSNIEHCQVIYEKDLLDDESKQETANRLFKYLDLKNHKISFNLKKINNQKWSDIIINYEEIDSFLKSKGHHNLLNH